MPVTPRLPSNPRPSILANSGLLSQESFSTFVGGARTIMRGLPGVSFLAPDPVFVTHVSAIATSPAFSYLQLIPSVAVNREIEIRFLAESHDARSAMYRSLSLGFSFAADPADPGPFIVTVTAQAPNVNYNDFQSLWDVSLVGFAILQHPGDFTGPDIRFLNQYRCVIPLTTATGVLDDPRAFAGLALTLNIQSVAGTGPWTIWDIVLNETGEFFPDTHSALLNRAQRYCCKSFRTFVDPGFGILDGAITFASPIAGIGTVNFPFVPYPVEMVESAIFRPAPEIWNPAIAAADPHNLTAGAQCTGTAIVQQTAKGFQISAQTPAGTAVGDILAYHYFTSASLSGFFA